MTRSSTGEWIKQTLAMLQGRTEFPYTETQVLLAYVLGKSKEWLIAHPDELLTQQQEDQLSELTNRLLAGEPLPYLTGIQAFYGLDFEVNPAVLIPRPETELLVEEAIQWLVEHPTRKSFIDVGTGSGAIAVTLADQVPDLKITAVDVSEEALEIAKRNAQKFSVDARIHFLKSDLFETVKDHYDLIAANLPYIPTGTLNSLPALRYEPHYALDGGADGLACIQRFVDQAPLYIKPGGLILMEIEASQGDAVTLLAQKNFPGSTVTLIRDYTDLPRIIKIKL